ncbi:hypothetical protein BGL_1c02020 [Burkholderia plantarii]|uniref:Lipoprotein n=2 Tax=Burkholderia plantarii TaxID=41899 RepID=A0A0B6RRF2_BURPL|nr:hypothetical protein BGL_1c02020 [Burkholderia plantarii]
MKPLMNAPKRIAACALLAGTAAALAGCGSSSDGPRPLAQSQAAAIGAPPGAMIYVSSALAAPQIEQCLSSRLSRSRVNRQGAVATVLVGPHSEADDWRITLERNAAAGTTIAVYPPRSGDGEPDEATLRFHLARCSV